MNQPGQPATLTKQPEPVETVRIVYQSEKAYQTTVRALMRAGQAFTTEEEGEILAIECARDALATPQKTKPETKPATVEAEPLTKQPRAGWVGEIFAGLFRACFACFKVGFLLLLFLVFPLVVFIPAFWAGVVSGPRSSGSGDGGGGTGGA